MTTKSPKEIALNFNGAIWAQEQGLKNRIGSFWAMLQSFFNIKVNSQASGSINYAFDPKSRADPTGGNNSVQLRGSLGRRWDVIAHETFHALGWRGHKDRSPKVTVMQATAPTYDGVPLRIGDFMMLLGRFGSAFSEDDKAHKISWNPETGDRLRDDNVMRNAFFQVRPNRTMLYDILYDPVGKNNLDFSQFKNALRIDLRASVNNEDGTINSQKIYGTRTHPKINFYGLNIINAPGTKLYDAVAGSGNDLMTGNAFANELMGNTGNDTFRGLGGNDRFDGGEGRDCVDYSMDQREGGMNGVVVNLSRESVTVKNKTVAAQSAIDGFGAIDTVINIEDVIGTQFSDVIIGDEGSNKIDGGFGDDILTGGAGADLFVYRFNYGHDVITDLDKTRDRVVLSKNLYTGALTAGEVDGGVLFKFSDTSSLFISNVKRQDIGQFLLFE